MKEILMIIKERLASKVPSLQYVGEDFGELDFEGTMPEMQWPCAFIDINKVDWSAAGSLLLMGDVQLRIRVADHRSFTAQQAQNDNTFGLFDILSEMDKVLHGWSSPESNYGPLTLVSTTRVKHDDGIREYEVVYAVQWKNTLAMPGILKTRIMNIHVNPMA